MWSPRTNSPGSTYSNSSASFSGTSEYSGCSCTSSAVGAGVISELSSVAVCSPAVDALSSIGCSVASSTFGSSSDFFSSSAFPAFCAAFNCSAANASSAALSCAFNSSIEGLWLSSDSSSKSNSSKFKSSSLSSSSVSDIGSAFFCTAFSCASFASSTADIGWLCDSDCELSTAGSLVPAIPLPTALPALSPSNAIGAVSAVVPVSVCAKVSCFSSESEDVFLEITSPIKDSISSCVTAPPVWLIRFFKFSKIVSLINPKSALASSARIISAFSCTTSWLIMRSISSENAGIPCDWLVCCAVVPSPCPADSWLFCSPAVWSGAIPACSRISSGNSSLISSGSTPASICFSR